MHPMQPPGIGPPHGAPRKPPSVTGLPALSTGRHGALDTGAAAVVTVRTYDRTNPR